MPRSTTTIVHHDPHHLAASNDPPVNDATAASATPYRAKRQGWYNGPLTAVHPKPQRKSPEGSSSSEGVATPSFSTAEYHPAIVNSDGYIESHAPNQSSTFHGSGQQPLYQNPVDPMARSSQQQHPAQDSKMSSLEVLVAVATNEDGARNTNAQPSVA
ncbi:MAG: hypothetical protein Q9220_007783 [cf. Caloplaca sp. 1 TL-2023]